MMSQYPRTNIHGNTIKDSIVITESQGPVNIRSVVNNGPPTIHQTAGGYYQERSLNGNVFITQGTNSGAPATQVGQSTMKAQSQVEALPIFSFKDKSNLRLDRIEVGSCTNRFYRNHINNQDVYPVNKDGESRALIINIKSFEKCPSKEREGADQDSETLKTLLPALGFRVQVHKNLAKEEIEEVVDKFLKSCVDRDAQMTLVYVGSHGGQTQQEKRDYFCSTDLEKVYVDDLCQKFSASQCPGLTGKPKIFLFQFCRAVPTAADNDEHSNWSYDFNTNWLKNVTQADADGRPPAKDNADMLLAFATASGNLAYRDEVNGSWFTTSLCKVLMEEAKDEDLLSMLTKVNSVVMNMTGSSQQEQMTEVKHTLCKKIFFYPGVNEICINAATA
ncbi:unnamed protein product [Clavelina lepadiformis]|uniref:Uncharacterized protein n=1 Tax=Clavelina lepadiformis TaxID=159417 RepID=A0ABP0GD56_CLALP